MIKLDRKLLAHLLSNFKLDKDGDHGLSHWLRVIRYSLRLARGTSVDKNLLILFGLLHDSQRLDEYDDHFHGPRASQSLTSLREGGYLTLSDKDFLRLSRACEWHTVGFGSEPPDIFLRIVWDADKLDLPRLGVEVLPELLWTDKAKDIVEAGRFIYVWEDVN